MFERPPPLIQQGQQSISDHKGEADAQPSAKAGEQRALGQQLSHESRAPGAERQPNTHLAPTGRCTREEQTSNVGARNEEDHGHDGHQQIQRARVVPSQRTETLPGGRYQNTRKHGRRSLPQSPPEGPVGPALRSRRRTRSSSTPAFTRPMTR